MKNIALKMVKVMQKCAYVQKKGENNFQHYKYASAANVLEKVNDSLAENNIASFVTSKLVEFKDVVTNAGKTEHLATVEVTILLVDADSGESMAITGLGSGQDNGDKGVMKAQTAAIKYAYMLSLNISTGDDPEADTGVDERNNDSKPAKTPMHTNTQPTTTKPVTTQATKPSSAPAKISDSQIKSLNAKIEKEGLTPDDVKDLLEWKFAVLDIRDLAIPEFAYCMNSLPKAWSDFVESQSLPA